MWPWFWGFFFLFFYSVNQIIICQYNSMCREIAFGSYILLVNLQQTLPGGDIGLWLYIHNTILWEWNNWDRYRGGMCSLVLYNCEQRFPKLRFCIIMHCLGSSRGFEFAYVLHNLLSSLSLSLSVHSFLIVFSNFRM